MINRFIVLSFLPLFLSSCSFIELQRDLDVIEASGTVHGSIIDKSDDESSVIIIVYDDSKEVIRFKYLHQDVDYYAFILPEGKKYHIVIFEDINQNLKYDKGEPSGSWSNPRREKLKAKGRIITPLTISKNHKIPTAYATDISELDESLGDKFVITTGEIADIDSKIFSKDLSRKGLWTPLKFLEENGLGVYFLEEYDPDKIPVLFIYGIGGYPQSWKEFFTKMDRSKYQPWFYFYPSGVRIRNAGRALDIIIDELRVKHKFDTMYVVAHSMGGLVAKSYITRHSGQKSKDYVKLFITISTPWSGDKDAEWAKHAPAVIPCWHDMPPDSEFIKELSAKKIPAEIPYYLLFSYHGDRKPFRRNNDNIVYLSSQLNIHMQHRAEKIYGFDLNHTEILSDPHVVKTVNAIFAEYSKSWKKKSIKKEKKSVFDYLW